MTEQTRNDAATEHSTENANTRYLNRSVCVPVHQAIMEELRERGYTGGYDAV